MREEAKRAYAAARAAHWAVAEQTERLRVALGKSTDLPELADAVYALRETAALCDDLRKEANRLKEQLERQACALWVKLGTGEPIRTSYCTGSPDVKQTPKTPKAGTPEYDEFCRHFNVDPSGFFRPHWPDMLQQLSELGARGEPLPPGCDASEMWTVFKVKVMKKRPVLEGADAPTLQSPELLRRLAALVEALYRSGPLDGNDQEGLAAARAAWHELMYEQERLDEGEDDDAESKLEAEETPF